LTFSILQPIQTTKQLWTTTACPTLKCSKAGTTFLSQPKLAKNLVDSRTSEEISCPGHFGQKGKTMSQDQIN
jgi:hypothetical protein